MLQRTPVDVGARSFASLAMMVWTAPRRHQCATLVPVVKGSREGDRPLDQATMIGPGYSRRMFSNSMAGSGWGGGSEAAVRREKWRICWPAPRGADRHGSVRLGASLGAGDQRAGPRGASDARQIREGYVKRGKSDVRDAEAICEAVQRTNMRFVPIKSVEQQIDRSLERARELLVKQRTQLMNASTQSAGRTRCRRARRAWAASRRLPTRSMLEMPPSPSGC